MLKRRSAGGVFKAEGRLARALFDAVHPLGNQHAVE
jgi:hypothetical protein